MIPFRKKRGGLGSARSHDDLHRKKGFGGFVTTSNRDLATTHSNGIATITHSNERLSGRSSLGNDVKWPFKAPLTKRSAATVVHGNQADRLHYVGSRLCNYRYDDVLENGDKNRTPMLNGTRLHDNGLRYHKNKMAPHSNGTKLVAKELVTREKRKSIVSAAPVNLGEYA